MSGLAKNVLVIGANSAIAKETARLYAKERARMVLVARDETKLAHLKEDLTARGAEVLATVVQDLMNFDLHNGIIEQAKTAFGGRIDICLFAHGILGDQKRAEEDYAHAEEVFRLNFLSVVSLLTPLANLMETQQHGSIIVISSVAGDRGRQSNYVYGASKGALNVFLAGLRNRLYSKGVHVMTVKPGFVDTPMTEEFDKQGFLWATPDVIAKGIVKAQERGCSEVYLPWFWRLIMYVIRGIPEFIFKRMKL